MKMEASWGCVSRLKHTPTNVLKMQRNEVLTNVGWIFEIFYILFGYQPGYHLGYLRISLISYLAL